MMHTREHLLCNYVHVHGVVVMIILMHVHVNALIS